ncbi:MAG: hormogonium polysaccharide biosynthesis protein HpsL [Cyanobacteria bacterium]|nr:hormogonium polysaccharide biosynthesis protein HpsL [Cyanobacteriota bacterium]MEB3269142.1 hormogonium polysaccharide biosynthesis protein HpsL [Leptolyngbya sp.]
MVKTKTKPTKAKKGKQKSKQAAKEAPKLTLKEQLALKRKAAKIRQAFIQYTSAVMAIALLIGLVVSVAVEPKLGIVAGGGIACLAMCFKYPRHAIYAFIIYVPFGGTVVYALGGSALLQLAKDAFFLPALIGVFLFCQKYKQDFILPKLIKIPLFIVLTVMMATMLFVNVPQHMAAGGSEQPILLGILGMKAIIGYTFLITCIYYLIRTKEDVYLVLRMQVILVIVCCALAFVQYMMLKTGRCQGTIGTGNELFRASLDSRCLVGGALLYSPDQGQVRLPGTFVAPWQWGWFLISSAFFTFGTAFNDRNFLWRIVGLVAMAMVAANAVICGQRIALALVPAVVVMLLVLTGQILNLKRFLPIGILLGLILVFMAAKNPEVLNERVESFRSRWEAAPPTAFITHQLEWAAKEQEGFFGRGAGRATNAARIFGKTALVETYHSKLLYEFGFLGLFAVLGLFTALTIATFKAYRSIKEPNLRGYGASMWVFVLFISYFPYYYPLDVDPVNVYYWLAAGIVLKLPDIDRQERLKQSEDGASTAKLSKKELKQLQKSQEAAQF